MVIHSMKLAQALPNETSLILFSEASDKRTKAYEIEMADRGYFKARAKGSQEWYMIFPANIAWVRCLGPNEKIEQVEVGEVEKKKPGRKAKSE